MHSSLWRIHPAVFMALAVFILLDGSWLQLAAYFAALLSHEWAHSAAAGKLGLRVSRLEMTPFGASASIEDIQQVSFSKQALITAAGPIASLSGCVSSLMMLRVAPDPWLPFTVYSLKANLFLLLFNLIPVLPLDGGRLLFSLLAPRFGVQRAARWLCRAGVWLGIGMSIIGVMTALFWHVYNLTLVLSGCYLAYAASGMCKTLVARHIHGVIQRRKKLEGNDILSVCEIAVSSKMPLSKLLSRLDPEKYCRVIAVDESSFETASVIEDEPLRAAMVEKGNMTLGEAFGLSKCGRKC